MHSSTALAAMAIMVGSAAAKVIQIDVGKGGFTFSPSSSTADVGDTLEFHFYSSLHTAVQGDFKTPCSRGSLESTGFNSGRVNNKPDGSPDVFQVPVTSTDPIWFYCSTPSHCQGGMAGVVNAPSSGNTLDAYISAAAGTSTSEGSATVQGGSLVPVGTQPSSVAGGGASSSSAAAPSSSAASVESSASSVASSASSEASAASSEASSASSAAAGGASTTASATGGGASSTAASGSPSTSATPSTASTSGAGNVQESIFKAQGLWAGIATGLGLVVFFMA